MGRSRKWPDLRSPISKIRDIHFAGTDDCIIFRKFHNFPSNTVAGGAVCKVFVRYGHLTWPGWPDLAWPRIETFTKVAKNMGDKVGENSAALRAAVFLLSAKNRRGVFKHPPPSMAKVNMEVTGTPDQVVFTKIGSIILIFNIGHQCMIDLKICISGLTEIYKIWWHLPGKHTSYYLPTYFLKTYGGLITPTLPPSSCRRGLNHDTDYGVNLNSEHSYRKSNRLALAGTSTAPASCGRCARRSSSCPDEIAESQAIQSISLGFQFSLSNQWHDKKERTPVLVQCSVGWGSQWTQK